MKGSVVVESLSPAALAFYARLCGWTLARAHARSGDPIAIAAYLGNGDGFDKSVTDFSERYADQNEKDFKAFTRAISSGRLEASEGVCDILRSIRARVRHDDHRDHLHPLIRLDLELMQERTARQRALRERRRQALERPEARAELLLAEAAQDVYFAAVDEIDNAIAQMDELALEQEFRDDDERA